MNLKLWFFWFINYLVSWFNPHLQRTGKILPFETKEMRRKKNIDAYGKRYYTNKRGTNATTNKEVDHE